jgi:N-acetylneuraminate synthase/N,N'-diacetyllegionaminate synthase
MLSKLELTRQDHIDFMEHCKRKGIIFLSTPFDEISADLLDDLDLPAYKIPSGEITNLPFLEYVARKGKPMIISTGMSTLEEVHEALRIVQSTGNDEVVLLHCVTSYPAEPADVNLRAMATMTEMLSVPVGYSDHTLGREIPLAAVALGACVIEKHFTLNRDMPGPDHQASMEPDELKSLVEGVRKVESAMGTGRKVPSTAEEANARVVRKSLVAARDIPEGSVITKDDLAAKRPGSGLSPTILPSLLGKEAKVAIDEGTIITMELLK